MADIAGLGPAALRWWGPTDDTDELYLRCPSDPTLPVQRVEAVTDPRLDALEGAFGQVDLGWINAKDYGAAGDGVADDASVIQTALNDAKDIASGDWYGAKVYLPPGIYLIGTGLTIPPGVELIGAGETATVLLAKGSTSFGYLLRNEVTTAPGQEFWWVRHLTLLGNKGSSATVTAGILCDGAAFVNSGIEHVNVFDCTGYGIHVKATGSFAGGPFFLENLWVARNNDHQIMVQGSLQQVWGRRVTVENQPANKYGIYLDGTPGGSSTAAGGHTFRDIHAEFSNGGDYAVRIHNVTGVEIEGLLCTGTPSGTQGAVHITGSGTDDYFGANHIVLKNIYPGSFTYAVNDEVRSKTVAGGKALTLYATDETYLHKFKPLVSGRFPTMLTDSGAEYGFEQNSNDLRFRYITGGVHIVQYGTDGSIYHYGRNRFDDGSAAVQLRHVGAATPTGGSSGDIVVGTGKIWVNDGSTWKSVAVS